MREQVRCQSDIVKRQQWVLLACIRRQNGKRTMCSYEQDAVSRGPNPFVNYPALDSLVDLSEQAIEAIKRWKIA